MVTTMSNITKSHKTIFLPFFLPPATMFQLFVSGSPPVVQIRTNKILKLEPLSHLDIVLDMQILNRSTHLVFHYKGGEIFLSSLFSTSVTSKHEFRNIFMFNCTRQTILIPSGYVLYTVNVLLNFPNEKGEILTIQIS